MYCLHLPLMVVLMVSFADSCQKLSIALFPSLQVPVMISPTDQLPMHKLPRQNNDHKELSYYASGVYQSASEKIFLFYFFIVILSVLKKEHTDARFVSKSPMHMHCNVNIERIL